MKLYKLLYILLLAILPLLINGQNGTFDWVVIGGGPGGAVMARRLAENFPSQTVLLLEKGLDNQDPVFSNTTCTPPPHLPATWTLSCTYPYVYAPRRFLNAFSTPALKLYFYTKQSGLNGRIPFIVAGSLLGGGTSVNGMIGLRPLRAEYNFWTVIPGLEEYNYYAMLSYYKKMENNYDSSGTPNDTLGYSGPVSVTNDKVPCVFATQEFFDAAQNKGFPLNHANRLQTPGLTALQKTISLDGRRVTASTAYLTQTPPNLFIRVKSKATKILFNTTVSPPIANRVEYLGPDGSTTYTITVNQEIILSGGAIESPKLLMLSGVGPAADLSKFGIPLVADNPAVGANFHEHPLVIANFNTTLYNPKMDQNLVDSPEMFEKWEDSGTGYLTASNLPYGIIGDYDVQFQDYTSSSGGLPRSYFAAGCSVGSPKSRGFLKLSSASHSDDPIIDPRLLNNTNDLDRLVQCMKAMRSLIQNTSYYNGDLKPPSSVYASDAALANYLRESGVGPSFHYGGSVAMGDQTAASDGKARVRGVRNLRVVDYSMVPHIFKANPSLSIYALAEKIADLIREERQAAPSGKKLHLKIICRGGLVLGVNTSSIWEVSNKDKDGYVFRWSSATSSDLGVYYVGARSSTYFYTSELATTVSIKVGNSLQDTLVVGSSVNICES